MSNHFFIKSNSSNEVTFSFGKRWLTVLTKGIWYGLLSLIIFVIIFYFFDEEYVLSFFAVGWITFIITGVVFTLVSLVLKKYLIKEIKIDRKQIHFKYYNQILDEKIHLPIEEINLICIANSNTINIQLLEHTFDIPAKDMTSFLDKFSHVTNLKFTETLRLDKKREVLKYKKGKKGK